MDVSTAMENNTTECENEKLVIDSNEKGKTMESEILKVINKNDLKRKIKTNGLRRCLQCGRSFSTLSNLERHKKRYHSIRNERMVDDDSDEEKLLVIDTHSKTAGNKKHRALSKTKGGSDIKWKYKEKDNVKRNILNHLSMMHGSYETIKKLVKML